MPAIRFASVQPFTPLPLEAGAAEWLPERTLRRVKLRFENGITAGLRSQAPTPSTEPGNSKLQP